MRSRRPATLAFLLVSTCLCLAGHRSLAQTEEPESATAPFSEADESASAIAAEALERVRQEAAEREASAAVPEKSKSASVRRNDYVEVDEQGPVIRNGVAYFEDLTIRVGARRLRLPAYGGWEAVRPDSKFFALQVEAHPPEHQLVSVLVNRVFAKQTDSKFVNHLILVSVPQEQAFLEMTLGSFAAFKEKVQKRVVDQRKLLVKREDFRDFEDYLNFKFGQDEKVEEFVDGFMVRAEDRPDLVVYFATSEFLFKNSRTEIRQPMISTLTFALVHGKLLRIDTKRIFISDEDVVRLISDSIQFVRDMRSLNDLSEFRPRR